MSKRVQVTGLVSMQANNFVIRDMLASDQTAARSIMQAAWASAYAHIYTPALLAKIFSEQPPQHADWTAERSGKLTSLLAEQPDRGPIGIAGMALRNDGDGELTQLYVQPAYQGCGVGIALWNAAIQRLRYNGCSALRVWVLDRAPAATFYANRKAALIGEDTYSIAGQDEKVRCYRFEF